MSEQNIVDKLEWDKKMISIMINVGNENNEIIIVVSHKVNFPKRLKKLLKNLNFEISNYISIIKISKMN
ncbi:hypothetical protein SAPIS_v1c06240 [Spiroplasma apis B31]|uniref:Uncharacterized protein n=1 Tax=Spiroplasma apis B31 TaxID=1276258 RepID=V5RIS9_SPIAP|nr:hypothetical protein SAPIS_v1c06240 [Spiroplasma apis B31]